MEWFTLPVQNIALHTISTGECGHVLMNVSVLVHTTQYYVELLLVISLTVVDQFKK